MTYKVSMGLVFQDNVLEEKLIEKLTGLKLENISLIKNCSIKLQPSDSVHENSITLEYNMSGPVSAMRLEDIVTEVIQKTWLRYKNSNMRMEDRGDIKTWVIDELEDRFPKQCANNSSYINFKNTFLTKTKNDFDITRIMTYDDLNVDLIEKSRNKESQFYNMVLIMTRLLIVENLITSCMKDGAKLSVDITKDTVKVTTTIPESEEEIKSMIGVIILNLWDKKDDIGVFLDKVVITYPRTTTIDNNIKYYLIPHYPAHSREFIKEVRKPEVVVYYNDINILKNSRVFLDQAYNVMQNTNNFTTLYVETGNINDLINPSYVKLLEEINNKVGIENSRKYANMLFTNIPTVEDEELDGSTDIALPNSILGEGELNSPIDIDNVIDSEMSFNTGLISSKYNKLYEIAEIRTLKEFRDDLIATVTNTECYNNPTFNSIKELYDNHVGDIREVNSIAITKDTSLEQPILKALIIYEDFCTELAEDIDKEQLPVEELLKARASGNYTENIYNILSKSEINISKATDTVEDLLKRVSESYKLEVNNIESLHEKLKEFKYLYNLSLEGTTLGYLTATALNVQLNPVYLTRIALNSNNFSERLVESNKISAYRLVEQALIFNLAKVTSDIKLTNLKGSKDLEGEISNLLDSIANKIYKI